MISQEVASSNIWIPDATPIILLGKIGLISLLTTAGDSLIIPQPVADEINAGPEDLGRLALATIAQRTNTRFSEPQSRSVIDIFGLDSGEAAVLTTALDETAQGYSVVVVMDETKGRTAARALGIETIGTVGLLIRAKREGVIKALVPCLHDLHAVGAWLSDDFCEKAAQSVDEAWP